ncbi:MAG: o-succinylbenzoate synthase [Candidatus Lambdaproteobacteria bacterium]|nr:o-succinylbenzoate synthase [Candidatus Lambdaproteobacteria bacterium]
MRLADIRLERYVLPFRTPFRTATLLARQREGWLLRLRDGEGRWGLGEAAPLPGFGMEPLAACLAALRAWAARLRGARLDLPRSPGDLTPGFDLLAGLALSPSPSAVPAAAHGLELALLDLAAQRAGVSLARWLTGTAPAPPPASVAVNALLGRSDAAGGARAAAALVGEGYGTLKLKLAGDEGAELAGVAAVRRAVGPEPLLRLDANGSWDEAEAPGRLERLAPFAIEYVEQPLPPGDLDAMARLARRSPIPLALDEGLQRRGDGLRALDLGAAAVFVLKPMALGGLLATLTLARAALARGVVPVVTTTLDGAVARTGALHAAAAIQGIAGPARRLPACGLATGGLLAADLVADAPQPHRGALVVPTAPGLGLGVLSSGHIGANLVTPEPL